MSHYQRHMVERGSQILFLGQEKTIAQKLPLSNKKTNSATRIIFHTNKFWFRYLVPQYHYINAHSAGPVYYSV